MKTILTVGLILTCMGALTQNLSSPPLIADEDGILSIWQKPFDVNNFFIVPYINFDDPQRNLKNIADCYFNTSGLWLPEKDFEQCEQLGLNVLVSSRENPFFSTNEKWKIPDEEVDAFVRKMVSGSGNSKAIVGYDICDEPDVPDYPKLAVAVEAVHKYAPGKLAFINLYPVLEPMSRTGVNTYQEYVEQFVEVVKPDIISYDNYMALYSMDQKNRNMMATFYMNMMTVYAASQKYKIPWWNVVASNQIRYHTVIPTLDNMMLQAYTSLAAGASAVCWYTYYDTEYDYAPVNTKGMRTNTWYALREVNRHLSILGPIIKTLKSTGVYFTDPTIHPSLPLLPGKTVKEIECSEPLMIGEFESAKGNRYVMVVNISLEHSARFILKTDIENERLFVVSTGEQTPYFQEILSTVARGGYIPKNEPQERLARSVENAYWIPAGQGVLIKCSNQK